LPTEGAFERGAPKTLTERIEFAFDTLNWTNEFNEVEAVNTEF
jgi:hypothetical protein